jgi:DNA-directed RNA polymerase III subunit RPC8
MQVVPELGLCVALYDMLSVGEARLYQGSPAQHISVEFRLVMFRPFVDEILVGTIIASTAASGTRAANALRRRGEGERGTAERTRSLC